MRITLIVTNHHHLFVNYQNDLTYFIDFIFSIRFIDDDLSMKQVMTCSILSENNDHLLGIETLVIENIDFNNYGEQL